MAKGFKMSVQMKRVQEGVQMYVKSPQIERLMRDLSEGRLVTNVDDQDYQNLGRRSSLPPVPSPKRVYWTDFEYYDIKSNDLEHLNLQDTTLSLGYHFSESMTNRSLPVSLSFLRIKGLARGIRLTSPGLVTTSMMKSFCERFDEYIAFLHREIIHPVKISIEVE
jgi:hypothetical protein